MRKKGFIVTIEGSLQTWLEHSANNSKVMG